LHDAVIDATRVLAISAAHKSVDLVCRIAPDVPQLVVYFSSHTLVEPSCDLATTRRNLRCKALESLLQTFHEHVESLRSEREGLRADAALARGHLTVLRGTSPGPEYQTHTRQLAELDARLRETAASLMPDQ
jgi:hypothetical protein